MKIVVTLLFHLFLIVFFFSSCSVVVKAGFNERVAESYRVICEDVLTSPYSQINGTRMGKYHFCHCMSDEYYNVLPPHADQNGNLPGDLVRSTFLRNQSSVSFKKCSYYLSDKYDQKYAEYIKRNINKN